MTDWQVRAARPDDLDRWRALYQGYADFYQTPQPDEAAALVWSWICDPAHPVDCLLAVGPDDVPVGLAHYRPYPRPLAARERPA
jgi:hypothetical protein